MKNLAILIDKPGYSQKFRCLTEELNKLPSNINVIVLTCEAGPIPTKANFPIMDLIHGYGFDGTVISTDIYTTSVMNNMLCPKDKYFYVWDLEYIYNPYSLALLENVFNNKLLARNQIRYDILKSSWKTPEIILNEFNYEQLQQLL